MKTPLRILHLEDDPNDAELVQLILKREGVPCSIARARDRSDFAEALERGNIDLVIADYSLPGFDGMSALKMTREKWPALPFILMSGTVGEEFAIDSLKGGATDYVLKERHSRLVPALQRAMQEVEERAERQRLEKQFLQAQKMEVVGQLSSGLAHDFNNILGIIIGNNDYMMAKLRPDDPLRKNSEEIQHAAERAAAMTRQLLLFSRNQTGQPVVLNLNEVIQDMDKMLHQLVDEPIQMAIHLENRIGRIKADSGYIGQLLMNLIINARDAMPNGGKLTIKTSNVVFGENDVRAHPEMTPGDYVMLAVSDTGVGMTDEVKARMFEVFFTTKPKGKGTGLGLAICQTIAKQANAHIMVESELGKGATFKVYFPRADQPLSNETHRLPTAMLPRGTETVLLVEDETALRRMSAMVLENQGYTVLQAGSGQEGVRMATEHKGEPISLIITDVVMPQMGGGQMAELLKKICPKARILFTSGYAVPTGAADGAKAHFSMLDPNVDFLPKPYTLVTLTGKIREMLDAA